MIRPQTMPAGPLSRRFEMAAVRDGGTAFRVEATEAERGALAASCDVVGIDALVADFRVVADGDGGLRVTGSAAARVRQVCVVSLEEFASDIAESVDLRFAPAAEVEALAAERAARPPAQEEGEDEDLPDPIVNGRIDLGALAAEMLVLGLDPYPRKPGVAFADPASAEPEAPDASPFAVLRTFKERG